MAAALEAGYDVAALALLFVCLALLLATKGIVSAFFAPFGHIPVVGGEIKKLASPIEGAIIGVLDDAIKGVERATSKFLSGLIDAFGLLIAIPALAVVGTKAALSYLWNQAIRPLIRSFTDPIRTVAAKAEAEVTALERTVASNLTEAETYARNHAASALQSAETYADSAAAEVGAALGHAITAAIAEAESYADQAVGRLRAAEDAAVAGAVGLAAEAKAAGLAAAAAAVAEAERVAGAAVSAEEAARIAAVAQLDAAGKAALGALEGLVVNVEDELATIEGQLGAAGVAALIASIPALATMVQTIAVESGLENAECRGKVKGICGTNTSAWESLLGSLAALGFLASLPELAKLANGMADELVPIIRQAA